MLDVLGRTYDYEEFRSELYAFKSDYPAHGLLADWLHVRISSDRILKLAREVFTPPGKA